MAATGVFLFGLSGGLARAGIAAIDGPAGSSTSPVPFTVRTGDSASEVGRRLEQEKLIRSGLLFRLLVSYRRVGSELVAGDYELSPSMRMDEIVDKFRRGEVATVRFTVPEGLRGEEIAEIVASNGFASREEFLRTFRQSRFNYGFLADRPADSALEGYLFPDTYSVSPRLSAEGVIDVMLRNFGAHYSPDMKNRAAAMGLSTYQVVTLASIVEREAVLPAERPVIAGVLLNRLRDGMPLETDPTVQYALGSQPSSRGSDGYWKRNLSMKDLEVDSPYNTYRNKGLPPGPIANPGLAAMVAVLNPTVTDYYFFVAKNDGSHAFSKTMDEHLRNVVKYRQ